MAVGPAKRRRSRYPVGVVAFALAARSRGVKWDVISRDITKQFKIKAPSPRRMRDWVMTWDQNEPASNAQSSERSQQIGALAEAYGSIGLRSGRLNEVLLNGLLLGQLKTIMDAAEAGKDPVVAAGTEILLAIYHMAGATAFDQILAEFRERRRLEMEKTKKMRPKLRRTMASMKESGLDVDEPMLSP